MKKDGSSAINATPIGNGQPDFQYDYEEPTEDEPGVEPSQIELDVPIEDEPIGADADLPPGWDEEAQYVAAETATRKSGRASRMSQYSDGTGGGGRKSINRQAVKEKKAGMIESEKKKNSYYINEDSHPDKGTVLVTRKTGIERISIAQYNEETIKVSPMSLVRLDASWYVRQFFVICEVFWAYSLLFQLMWGDMTNAGEGTLKCYQIKNDNWGDASVWVPFLYPPSRECSFFVRETDACRFDVNTKGFEFGIKNSGGTWHYKNQVSYC